MADGLLPEVRDTLMHCYSISMIAMRIAEFGPPTFNFCYALQLEEKVRRYLGANKLI
jgi:hypothetical protein